MGQPGHTGCDQRHVEAHKQAVRARTWIRHVTWVAERGTAYGLSWQDITAVTGLNQQQVERLTQTWKTMLNQG